MEIKSGAKFKGIWEIEVLDKTGKLISKSRAENIITDEGLNRVLNVFLHGTTQTSPWYCGLVESNTDAAAGMTYDEPVFTESTAYDEATRPIYNEAASTAKSTTNSANKAVFTASATKTFYGAALFSIDTKGDHTAGADNVLACYGKFAAGQPVIDGNVVNLTYTITAADAG